MVLGFNRPAFGLKQDVYRRPVYQTDVFIHRSAVGSSKVESSLNYEGFDVIKIEYSARFRFPQRTHSEV